MQSLYTDKDKEEMLKRDVANPKIQPNAINAFDVIKSEHDTNKGKGGLQNFTGSSQIVTAKMLPDILLQNKCY